MKIFLKEYKKWKKKLMKLKLHILPKPERDVHLLMNNYDDNGRVLETKHSNNCYIANALLVIVHDIYDSIDSEAERLVELTEEINNSVFDIELSASNDLSDRYCSAYPKLKAILELFSNIISKYKS